MAVSRASLDRQDITAVRAAGGVTHRVKQDGGVWYISAGEVTVRAEGQRHIVIPLGAVAHGSDFSPQVISDGHHVARIVQPDEVAPVSHGGFGTSGPQEVAAAKHRIEIKGLDDGARGELVKRPTTPPRWYSPIRQSGRALC